MTADIKLTPSSVAAFTEALKGESGSLDAWLEVNDESEVAAHIEAYASACVSSATAEKDAEIDALRTRLEDTVRDSTNKIEALRTEVERANSWNERVSVCRDHVADIVDGLCVICSLDAAEDRYNNLQEEVERLRAIAGCAYQMAGMHDAPEVWLDRLGQAANGDALPDPDTISDELLPYQPDAVCEAEARAERLAEALREAYRQVRELCDCYGHAYPEESFARYEALLRGQEEGGGYWPEMPKNGGTDWTGFDG